MNLLYPRQIKKSGVRQQHPGKQRKPFNSFDPSVADEQPKSGNGKTSSTDPESPDRMRQ